MNIIILSEKDQISEKQYRISDERFVHITNILKSEAGDIIEIGIINFKSGKAKIISVDKSELIIEIIELYENKKSKINIDLICALPRPQTLKKVLLISATFGVKNLFFIKSEKVEKSYFHSPLLFEENYNKYLIEGLSQGKRIDLPNVTFHKYFKKFFENDFKQENYNSKLLAHPNSEMNLLQYNLHDKENIIIAIGPEGGWNDFEIDYMINFGFKKFILSKNILRVESAVTSTLSQIELLTF